MNPRCLLRRLLFAGLLAVLTLLGRRAHATPLERFNADYFQCVSLYVAAPPGGSFTCSVCGVDAGCTGSACSWGGLSFSANGSGQLNAALFAGYQLYCLNTGGSMIASASAVGVQSRAIDRAFRALDRGAEKLSAGGLAEYSSLDGGNSSTYGGALPISATFPVGKASDLDLGGNVIFGNGEHISQMGANVRPMLRYLGGSPGAARGVLGVSIPMQLLSTAGDGLDRSFGYAVGGGVIAGVAATRGFGIGVTSDFSYARGVQLPTQVLMRFSAGPPDGWRFTVQPGVSADLRGASRIADVVQGNLLVGLDFGSFILGLQGFAQSSKDITASLGLSHVSRAARLATSVDVGSTLPVAPAEPEPEGPPCRRQLDCGDTESCVEGHCVDPSRPRAAAPVATPCRRQLDCSDVEQCKDGFCVDPRRPPAPVQAAPVAAPAAPDPPGTSAVVADALGDVAAGARMRAAINALLREHQLEPKPKAEVDRVASGLTGGADPDTQALEDARKALDVDALVVVIAKSQDATARARIHVVARSGVLVRDASGSPAAVGEEIRRALEEMLETAHPTRKR